MADVAFYLNSPLAQAKSDQKLHLPICFTPSDTLSPRFCYGLCMGWFKWFRVFGSSRERFPLCFYLNLTEALFQFRFRFLKNGSGSVVGSWKRGSDGAGSGSVLAPSCNGPAFLEVEVRLLVAQLDTRQCSCDTLV